jgi:hypothetical protein
MKYFTIEELSHSDTAVARKIDNNPSHVVVENLEALVLNVLDPLREAYGKPIRVNSGYRSPRLNLVIGGAKNSQHMTGEAVDITAGSKEDNKWLFDYIFRHLPYDQLIDESNYSWVHVSFKNGDTNRQQVLRL